MVQFKKETIAQQWESLNIEDDLLSDAAKGIGAGSATDAGRFWRLPTEHPDPIVLAGGIPDDTALPIKDLIESFSKSIEEDFTDSLMYGGWFGYEGLRQLIADRQNKIEGTNLLADNIIMHNGSSGCLENICKAFVGPGDVAIVESPSYSGTVRAIRGFQAEVIEVPMSIEGINPDLFRETVESLMAQGKRVKLFYTIPDYHNPMGNVTTLEIRKSILEICAEHKILIAEDAAYTELYYDTPPPPSYYALSDGHGVIKMCSFSKILATGLRSGWIQARDELAEPLTKVRFDMGNSPLVHYALADLIGSGKLDTHINSMRALYKSKCQTMIDSLKKYCGPYIELDEPEGGYFLWVKCTQINAFDLIQAAAEEGVVFPLGSIFYVDSSLDTSHFRLAFTRAPFEHLEEAGKRIGKAFEKVLDLQN
tara:strand:+ start:11695 stop:12963 length:1269 start_codon:yes stop_codon:yes gene_type:complete